jgi:hypothetical protein
MEFFREAAALRPLVRAVIASVLREAPDHVVLARGIACLARALSLAGADVIERDVARDPEEPGPDLAAAGLLRLERAAERLVRAVLDVDSEAAVIERIADPCESAADKIERAQRAQAVREALESLPEGPRRALEMSRSAARSTSCSGSSRWSVATRGAGLVPGGRPATPPTFG